MKTFLAFCHKEQLEGIRNGKAIILAVVFGIFGIMNPAIAKLTPWMMDTLTDSLSSMELSVSDVKVTALTSWEQFFKNIPLAMGIFLLQSSSCFTKEYQEGTLILVVTKGLSRYKIVLAKLSLMMLFWTFCFWLCFGITYGYNAYFWDNAAAHNLPLVAGSWWLFGLWAITLLVFFSSVMDSTASVILGTGAVILLSYFMGLIPKISAWLPASMLSTVPLYVEQASLSDYKKAYMVTLILCAAAVAASLKLINRKQL